MRPNIWRLGRGILASVLAVIVFASVTALALAGGPPWGTPPGACTPPGLQNGLPGNGPSADQYGPPGAVNGPPGRLSGVSGLRGGCPPGLQSGRGGGG